MLSQADEDVARSDDEVAKRLDDVSLQMNPRTMRAEETEEEAGRIISRYEKYKC